MGFSSPIIGSPVWPVSSTFAHVADGVLTTACSPRQPIMSQYRRVDSQVSAANRCHRPPKDGFARCRWRRALHHLARKDDARFFRAFDGSDTEEAFDRARSDAHERLQTQRFRTGSCLMATRQESDRSCEEEMRSNQSMKPTAPFRCKSNVLTMPPCRGLSVSLGVEIAYE